jgi:hemin uptake protein HemP
MNIPPTPPPQESRNPVTPGPRIISSKDLFQGEQELHIQHDGAVYRLRVTQHGKLILNK